MTLEKAIELIDNHLHSYNSGYPEDLRNAIKLGIEAMKREGERRLIYTPEKSDLLPGETP